MIGFDFDLKQESPISNKLFSLGVLGVSAQMILQGVSLPQTQYSWLRPRWSTCYTKEEVEPLRILLYTSVDVCINQRSMVEIQCNQQSKPRKPAWSTVKTPKRTGQGLTLWLQPWL